MCANAELIRSAGFARIALAATAHAGDVTPLKTLLQSADGLSVCGLNVGFVWCGCGVGCERVCVHVHIRRAMKSKYVTRAHGMSARPGAIHSCAVCPSKVGARLQKHCPIKLYLQISLCVYDKQLALVHANGRVVAVGPAAHWEHGTAARVLSGEFALSRLRESARTSTHTHTPHTLSTHLLTLPQTHSLLRAHALFVSLTNTHANKQKHIHSPVCTYGRMCVRQRGRESTRKGACAYVQLRATANK